MSVCYASVTLLNGLHKVMLCAVLVIPVADSVQHSEL